MDTSGVTSLGGNVSLEDKIEEFRRVRKLEKTRHFNNVLNAGWVIMGFGLFIFVVIYSTNLKYNYGASETMLTIYLCVCSIALELASN